MADVPQKYFYTIGDVCKLTGTKPHILRYWESQFKLLRPARRYSGHRKYTQNEVDLIQKIKFLIIDRKFTLAGAKKEIVRQMRAKTVNPAEQKPEPPKKEEVLVSSLADIKKDIEGMLAILGKEQQQQELLTI